MSEHTRWEELMANTRDASWLGTPRHDGEGGHRPGAWSPKYHVKLDEHPVRGGSWSACGTVFLIGEGDTELADVSPSARCQRNGCRQLWPDPRGEQSR